MNKLHIPLLVVYFSVGMSGMSAVAAQLFMTNTVTLSAAVLTGLAIYTGLPWSIKPLFGQLVDRLRLRRAGIILGQIFVASGLLVYADLALTNHLKMLGQYTQLLLGGLFVTLGTVISDIVADVMAIELAETDEQIGKLQAYSRAALMAGGLLGAIVSGPLAAAYAPGHVFLFELILPAIVIIIALVMPVRASNLTVRLNRQVLVGSIIFGATALIGGLFLGDYGQLVTGTIGSAVLMYLLYILTKNWTPKAKKEFGFVMFAIFMLRVTPGIGPSGNWWYINELKFDPEFLGQLRIGGTVMGLLATLGLAKIIGKASTFKVLGLISVMLIFLGLPELLIYYSLTGLPDKGLAFFDTVMTVPLANLAMVVLGTLVGKHAPRHELATYTTVTAGLMNIALVWGNIIEQWINKYITVTREDFSQLGQLMLTVQGVSIILTIIGLSTLYKGTRNEHK